MSRKTYLSRYACLIVVLLGGAALAASGESKTSDDVIFRIGTFNRSSTEFAGGSPAKPVDYVVGKSSPATDWHAMQPILRHASGANQDTPQASAPWSIRFNIDEPHDSYELHVALLIENSCVPQLQVGINGKQGRFYLHPVLDYDAGDPTGTAFTVYSHADLVFRFPGNFLHSGENIITLQAVEEAGQAVSDAALNYDAVELAGAKAGIIAKDPVAQINPTIFYKQTKNGLEEVVEVLLRQDHAAAKQDAVELSIAGKRYRHAVAQKQDYGDQKFDFIVPEFKENTPAQLTWRLSGKQNRIEKTIDPAKKWTLYLVPHIHLDIGYTDYQAKVAAIQSRVIDEALDLTEKHPEFRFSLDGSWPLEQYLRTRVPDERERVIAGIQNEKLFVPAQYANLLTGFPTAETLIRSLYASANFSRTYRTPLNYANITDVPSYSWSYPSVLGAAGIHTLLAASDNYRAPILLRGHLNENSPFWWQGPDGQRVLMWYSRHYQQMQFVFGLPPLVSAGREILPLFLQQYQKPSYKADAAIIYGTQAENTDLFPQQAGFAAEWNDSYAYPRLRYSGFFDAVQDIAKQFGDTIPTLRGDGGPYWEDGIGSDAKYAAMERENESRAPSAEKLVTLSTLVNPRLAADKEELDSLWKNILLMDEHTWDSSDSVVDPTSDEAVQQLEVKDQYALNAQTMRNSLARSSMASIADSISTPADSLIVFNTLNWNRRAVVTVDLDNWNSQVVDKSTGKVVPLEVLHCGHDYCRVRFVADNVPAMGYKVYQLPDTDTGPSPSKPEHKTVMENSFYRVTIDPGSGAVQSIYDKELRREMVNLQSPYRFGEFLYVTGGDKGPNSLLQYGKVLGKPDLEINHARNGQCQSVVRIPDGSVAHLTSTNVDGIEVKTDVRLFDQEKKIEFVEEVNKPETDHKEAAYFAFPMAMKKPRFRYEIQNGVVNPAEDMLAGSGREWFSVQHWVSADEDGVSGTIMPIDAPLITLGDINRGEWPSQVEGRPGTIFSYVMNNYWSTNYRARQGGKLRFRYVFTSGPTPDASALSRMGWEEFTPIEYDIVSDQDKAVSKRSLLNGKESSFLNVEDNKLYLSAWKPAEDGNGTILRFVDLGGDTRTVSVFLKHLGIMDAWLTDAVERNQARLPLLDDGGFRFSIHQNEIVTMRVVTEQERHLQTP